MSDVYDGSAWKQDLAEDSNLCPHQDMSRNLKLVLSSDGVQPMKRKTYSMWPMAFSCQNIPAHMRMTALWLAMIVPLYGEHHGEADDFQPLLELVVDELRYGLHVSFDTEDCLTG